MGGTARWVAEHKLNIAKKTSWVLVAVPMLILLVTLLRYSVNVPFWDQWEYVSLLDKLHNGTLTLADLWRQHNEHRILFPKVVTLLLSLVTGYNVRFEVVLNFLTASLTFYVLSTLLRQTFNKARGYTIVAAPIIAWILFSPVQWINWIWGFQLCFFMGIAATVLTIRVLMSDSLLRESKHLYVAIVTATIATYSLGNGLVVWIVGLGLLIVRHTRRRDLLVWCGSAGAVIASYLYGFHRSPESLSLLVVAKQPIAVLKYTLSYLGHNLATTAVGARYAGAILLGIIVLCGLFLYRRKQIEHVYGWLAISTFVCLTALIAAISRLNFGIDHSMGNSYTSISALFVVVVVVMVLFTLYTSHPRGIKDMTKVYVLVVFLLGVLTFPAMQAFVTNYVKGYSSLVEISSHFKRVRRCVYEVTSVNDTCLDIVYPNRQKAWQSVEELRSLKLGPFREIERSLESPNNLN